MIIAVSIGVFVLVVFTVGCIVIVKSIKSLKEINKLQDETQYRKKLMKKMDREERDIPKKQEPAQLNTLDEPNLECEV